LQEIREINQQLLLAGLRAQELAEAAQEAEQRTRQAQQTVILREQEAAVLAERTRIAEDFHDTLAQYFTAIKLQLDLVEALLSSQPQEAREHLQRARDFTTQCVGEAHRCIRGLRSQELAHRDLPAALAELVRQMEDSPASVPLVVEGTPCELSLVIASNLFYIGQEALTNALRHASASQIIVTLAYMPDQVRLRIEDNGQGFNPQEARVGFGLIGLRERAARLGAELAIRSASGQGTDVMVTVNLLEER
jgi:signal transduction histidine kinase